jgi:hypothetical protein
MFCARCFKPAPCPEPVEFQDEDGDSVYGIPCPVNWFPSTDSAPAIVCVDCATDDEINSWLSSAAWLGDGLEPLICVGCVRVVDPMSDDAQGWVLVTHSVDDGDEHDDTQWKCPDCASASDEHFGDPDRRVLDALRRVFDTGDGC